MRAPWLRSEQTQNDIMITTLQNSRIKMTTRHDLVLGQCDAKVTNLQLLFYARFAKKRSNVNYQVKVVPMYHGTTFENAWKIAHTGTTRQVLTFIVPNFKQFSGLTKFVMSWHMITLGFAVVSSRDQGWYGKMLLRREPGFFYSEKSSREIFVKISRAKFNPKTEFSVSLTKLSRQRNILFFVFWGMLPQTILL